MGCHQDARKLSWVGRRVRGLGHEALEQAPGAHQGTVELRGDLRVRPGGGVDRPQEPPMLRVKRDLPLDHRCDQILGRTALHLIDKRVVDVGQQLGGHLCQVIEVAVEDSPRQTGVVHHVTNGERGEWSVEKQLARGGQDAAPRLVGGDARGSLRHSVASLSYCVAT